MSRLSNDSQPTDTKTCDEVNEIEDRISVSSTNGELSSSNDLSDDFNNQNINNQNLDTNINASTVTQNEEGHNLTELVVLDPDHPLMTRFQIALNDMLTEHLSRIELEEREILEDLRKHRTEHLESGTELFTVQGELAQFQSQLGHLYTEYESAKERRVDVEKELVETKYEYKIVNENFMKEYNKIQQLRNEMDNLSLRLFYLRSAQTDIKGDIAVMKRAAEKAVVDLYKAEQEKMHQDYLLDTLVSESDKLKEDISLYEAQIIAQEDEKCAAQQTLREAEREIEAIITERRKITNRWNSSFLDLERRSEALHGLKDNLTKLKEHILVLDNEIQAYRRTTQKEQNVNEQLTLIIRKSENDLKNIQKTIGDTEHKIEYFKENYSKNVMILQQVEVQLSIINKEKQELQGISDDYYKKLQNLTQLRNDIEDRIEAEIRNKLVMESAKSVTDKLTKKKRDETRELEATVVKLDNLLSKNLLKIAEIETEILEIKKLLSVMNKETDAKNDLINKLELESKRSKITLEVKQDIIDRLNNQYFSLLNTRGGVELGPLESTVSNLNREIVIANENVSNLEQLWLREQHDIVRLLNQKEEITNSINRLKQQIVLLTQKKIRIGGYIDQEDKQTGDIQKDLLKIQNELVKINRIIDSEKHNENNLDENNSLAEIDFIRELKEEEMATAELQSKIENVDQSKDEILKETIETQWQVMMYEKRIQLVYESKATMKSEIGLGEIKAMRAEIHRMEVRYQQLRTQQELLIQGMEKSVSKRDILTTRGEVMEKISNKVETKAGAERKIIQLKKKIKEMQKSTADCEENTVELHNKLEENMSKLMEENEKMENVEKELANFEIRLEELIDSKYGLTMSLQYRQQLNKYYTEFRDKKYIRICKTTTSLERETAKYKEKINYLILIIERLMSDFPQVQKLLKPVYEAVQFNASEVD